MRGLSIVEISRETGFSKSSVGRVVEGIHVTKDPIKSEYEQAKQEQNNYDEGFLKSQVLFLSLMDEKVKKPFDEKMQADINANFEEKPKKEAVQEKSALDKLKEAYIEKILKEITDKI